jgi:hypothetical protein
MRWLVKLKPVEFSRKKYPLVSIVLALIYMCIHAVVEKDIYVLVSERRDDS